MAILYSGRTTRTDAVHIMAGTIILVSLALYYWVSVWFLIVPAFVGANLFQFGITGLCPADFFFGLLGLPVQADTDCSCDNKPQTATANNSKSEAIQPV